MRRVFRWFWNRGVVGTFLTGFFVVLPVMLTIMIMGWVGEKLRELIGPGSRLGQVLRTLGMRFVGDEWVASVVGWCIVLGSIWIVGAIVRAAARYKVEEAVHSVFNRMPIIRSIYGPVSKVVGMLHKSERPELAAMSVVYCQFGDQHGVGFLGLLASSETYRFGGLDCHVVYLPTSPIPMSGGILFVPVASVQKIDMKVDDLMQIYFSLGVLTPTVVPRNYLCP